MEKNVEEPRAESLLQPTLVTVAVHALAPIALTIVLIFIVPRFRESFEDFDVDLPVLTAVVLAASHWARNYFFILPVILGACLAVDALVYYTLRRSGGRVWCGLWGVLVVLIEGAAVAAVVLGMFLPLVRIMTKLAG